ncbi:MAG: methionine synthase [Puniceicoccales bacterium]|nr:methionine synthase [Puniceicoccales bacterium]
MNEPVSCPPLALSAKGERLAGLIRRRIVYLDGALGSLLQRRGFSEEDFRGEHFAGHPCALKGNYDVLVLTQPGAVAEVHRMYLDAGADIIQTNTFNATRVVQADYGLEAQVRALNLAAARVAREVASAVEAAEPGRECWVAGDIGPTGKTLSLSRDVNDPGAREITFVELCAAYREQVAALLDGGVDVLMLETIFDTLNAKAALFAIDEEFCARGERVPVMISCTTGDASGRLLAGQTVEAFWNSVRHARPLSVGINCALGAARLRPYIEELSAKADCFVSCHPNAGLPDPLSPTGFPEGPEDTALALREFARAGIVNILGGCCGTTPEHIRAIARATRLHKPRRVPVLAPALRLGGLEAFNSEAPALGAGAGAFIMVGERANVTGSPRFRKLVVEGKFAEALVIVRQQIESGADIIDVNFDEALLDGAACMTRFLNLLAAEPDLARAPLMLDSSRWEVIEAGLRCAQGKSIVNSLSLKEGEAVFLARARLCRRHGAALIVMAFDEEGQATTLEARVRICERAYRLLTADGFPAEDILFDCNVLTVGTGIPGHAAYAADFIESVRALRQRLPHARFSGGVSNVSFAFRGNNRLREAMHAAFLHHATAAGLDMGIVNPGLLEAYDAVDPRLRALVEDVLLNRRADATERLLEAAPDFATGTHAREARAAPDAWREAPVDERLAHALLNGITEHLEKDIPEALAKHGTALAVIEGPLMNGMQNVGVLFGAGKMFLPQVVKSARVMKQAVAQLAPHMAANPGKAPARARPTALLATVKGDVHDIGKNIVGIILACNNYKVIDLGVMVPCEKILAAARAHNADLIGLSGLITPSLEEMIHVASEMERQGMSIPLNIGGATTSALHTALKIAPRYTGPVIHTADASLAASALAPFLNPGTRADATARHHARQNLLRQRHDPAPSRTPDDAPTTPRAPLVPLAEARARAPAETATPPVPPQQTGTQLIEVPAHELTPLIDWAMFFHAWNLHGKIPRIFDHARQGPAARQLHADAQEQLRELLDTAALCPRALFGIHPVQRHGESVTLHDATAPWNALGTFHFLRQQKLSSGAAPARSPADFISPTHPDWLGAFIVTAGAEVEERARHYKNTDPYKALLTQTLADRIVEAAATWLHTLVFTRHWPQPPAPRTPGIRPAFGYPILPDHSEKSTLWRIMDAGARIGVTLTETCMMHPPSSVCGLFFAHPGAHYFAIGPIGEDQLEDYAARKNIPLASARKWLVSNLQ